MNNPDGVQKVILTWVDILEQVWLLVTQYWFLSMSVLLFLFNLIITIVNNSSRSQ